jgi:hypothetical protein
MREESDAAMSSTRYVANSGRRLFSRLLVLKSAERERERERER